MSQTHSSVSYSGLDPYVNADVYCWWDIISCPPINCNPYSVLNDIRKGIKCQGYYGRIFIQAHGEIQDYPLSVQLGISKVVKHYDAEGMVYRLCMWALSNPPPATYLLISDNIDLYSHALKQLKSRRYNVVIARPCSSSFNSFVWETLSIGASPIVPAKSLFVVHFGRTSIFDVQTFFYYLHNTLGEIRLCENKPCHLSRKGKSTVIIIRVEGPDTPHTHTSLKYASYYKKMGWKPALICIGTSCVDDLMHDADLAAIPVIGSQTESMAYDAMKSCRKTHNLIIVDTSICIAEYDAEDIRGPQKMLHRLYKAVKPDIVLFAVEPAYIIDVHRWSEVDPRMGIILLIDESTNNQGREFLDQLITTSTPIMFFQMGDKFEAFSIMQLVELVLGVCKSSVLLDEYTLEMMTGYYLELKKNLCSRHLEMANEVLPNTPTRSELLIAAYKIWSYTPTCEDCSRNIYQTYPEARSYKALRGKTVFVRVKDLTPGTEGHNLVVTVVTTKVVPEKDVADSRIAECLVGDPTGVILFTARNEQVDMMQPGSTVILRNAKIYMFEGGFMRLTVDEWGLIEVTEPASFTVEEGNNLSVTKHVSV